MPSTVSFGSYTRMSEAIATPVPTTPTSPTSLVGAKKFEGVGLPFKAKLIGMEDLSADRDEKLCLESMFKLKAVANARGEHKQRIQLNLTMSAVKVTDELTKTLVASHEIERISFVVLDPRDNRAFGYIYNTTDDRHQFWAIKTEKSAAITVLALKELFEIAFDLHTQNTEENKAVEPTPTSPPPAPVTTPQVPVPTPVEVPPPVTDPTPAPVPEPTPVVEQASIIDLLDGPLVQPVVNPTTSKPIDVLLWDDFEPSPLPPPVPVQPPKQEEDYWMKDLISSSSSTNNPEPIPTTLVTKSIFDNPAPAPLILTTPTPTPLIASPMSPTSPVAPSTVSNPLLDFDFFGPASTGKVTKDAFFSQPEKQTIAQLQDRKT